MKIVLLLSAFLWAVSAAPAEVQTAAGDASDSSEASVESLMLDESEDLVSEEEPEVEDIAAPDGLVSEEEPEVEDVAAPLGLLSEEEPQVEDAAAPLDLVSEEEPEVEDAAAPFGLVSEQDPEDAAAPGARLNLCGQGWFSHRSRCYRVVGTPKTWVDAEEHCNLVGGNLASVTNPQEYFYLQQITQQAGHTNVWLGGFSLQGRWLWIDRQGFYYTNWSTQHSSTTYPCIHLQLNTGWSNQVCTITLSFICSKNPSSC